MSSLFGDDFAARGDLQRRQVFHQELLDSRRFESPRGTDAFATAQHPRNDRGASGDIASKVVACLALIFFSTLSLLRYFRLSLRSQFH